MIFSLVILLLCLFSVSFKNYFIDDEDDTINDINNIVDKNIVSEKINIIGTYSVKDDIKSRLIIEEEGKYTININVCEKYIELSGNYEIADKKLKLINYGEKLNYDTLDNNFELSFTIIDENKIRLDEDLECVIQNTVFER